VLKNEAAPQQRRRRLRFLFEILFLLTAFAAIHFWQTREMVGGAMPPLAGPLADGRQTSLEAVVRNAGGRPVLLYVWSSWCPICRAEEGTIAALAADWPVLTLAMQSGDPDTVAKFMRERGLAYPALVDTQGELAWRLGVRATPAWFVIDRSGTIRFSGMGYTTGWGLRARLLWAQAFS
jgi:thiol-disulfide isomerase/thioredoxin